MRSNNFAKYLRTKNKFGAVRTKIDGFNFASKLEATVYLHLKSLMQAGKLSEIKCQPSVVISVVGINGKTKEKKYRPDFMVADEFGRQWYVEAKGVETDRFRDIKFLWSLFMEPKLEIYKGRGKGIYLADTLSALL